MAGGLCAVDATIMLRVCVCVRALGSGCGAAQDACPMMGGGMDCYGHWPVFCCDRLSLVASANA